MRRKNWRLKGGLTIGLLLVAVTGCGSSDSTSNERDVLSKSRPDPDNQFTCEPQPAQPTGDELVEVARGTDAQGEPFSVALKVANDGYPLAVFREAAGSGAGGLDLRDPSSPPMQRQGNGYEPGIASFSGTASEDVDSVIAIYSAGDKEVQVDACLGAVSTEDAETLGAPGAFGFWHVTIPAPQVLLDNVDDLEQDVKIIGYDVEGEEIGEAAPPEPTPGPERTVTATSDTVEK